MENGRIVLDSSIIFWFWPHETRSSLLSNMKILCCNAQLCVFITSFSLQQVKFFLPQTIFFLYKRVFFSPQWVFFSPTWVFFSRKALFFLSKHVFIVAKHTFIAIKLLFCVLYSGKLEMDPQKLVWTPKVGSRDPKSWPRNRVRIRIRVRDPIRDPKSCQTYLPGHPDFRNFDLPQNPLFSGQFPIGTLKLDPFWATCQFLRELIAPLLPPSPPRFWGVRRVPAGPQIRGPGTPKSDPVFKISIYWL